jgi:hypothetical protein
MPRRRLSLAVARSGGAVRYASHKASGKPYLRPMVPTQPAQSIINVDPAAARPQQDVTGARSSSLRDGP